MSSFSWFFLAPAAALAAISALSLTGVAANAAPISVSMDEVRMVTFAKPVKTVFIGNPIIADVTIIDRSHVFLLGKNFGSTNLVALDDAGNQTVDEKIVVLGRSGSAVTLQRGAARSSLVCTPEHCEGAPTPGDQTEPFDTLSGQIDKREAQSLKAAGGP